MWVSCGNTWTFWLPMLHATLCQIIDSPLNNYSQKRKNLVYGLTISSHPGRGSFHIFLENFILCIVKGTQRAHQHKLGQDVVSVNLHADPNWVDNNCYISLPKLVIWYRHMIIYQIGIWVGTCYYNPPYIPTWFHWAINRITQRPQHITHCNSFFCHYPYGTELCGVTGGLNDTLYLNIPTYRGWPNKTDINRDGSTHDLIMGMFGIKVYHSTKMSDPRLW